MGKGSLTKFTSQPSPSLGSKGGTYSPPPNQGGQPLQFGPSDMMYRGGQPSLDMMYRGGQPSQFGSSADMMRALGSFAPPNQGGQPSLDMMYRGGPKTQQQKVFKDQQELNMLGAQNQARQYQPQPSYTESPETTIGHFGMDEYGRGFGQGFMGPPPNQGGQPSQFGASDMMYRGGQPSLAAIAGPYSQASQASQASQSGIRPPNPYAMPFENRYARQVRPAYSPFVPVSAKNYLSPFSVGGEQTYFNRPIETAPAPAPAPASDPAPAYGPSYPIDYVSVGGASGGVVKSAAGRYLQGAGDGTSDSIPATIGGVQPARLADGEFVIDARTVSEIGNGSSNAGAKKLYAMMERVHNERKKAKRGQNTNADRFLPR